jgi:hypothetical protein
VPRSSGGSSPAERRFLETARGRVAAQQRLPADYAALAAEAAHVSRAGGQKVSGSARAARGGSVGGRLGSGGCAAGMAPANTCWSRPGKPGEILRE